MFLQSFQEVGFGPQIVQVSPAMTARLSKGDEIVQQLGQITRKLVER